jgi:murein DD-endopeptidase MepM/ murein hydrolase activator NlpD
VPRAVGRCGRALVRACAVGLALATLPSGAGFALGSTTTSTKPTTVPTGTPPTTAPAPSITPITPTTTPVPPTIPANPSGEHSALTPDQTTAAQTELASLTDSQRALLRQLQTARESLAVRRFALVALASQVATAQERVDAARAVEAQARAKAKQTADQLQTVRNEIVGLAAAAYRNHEGTQALGALVAVNTNSASALVRARTYARSDASLLSARVDALNSLERRLESEQHSAEAARADAEAGAADLSARLAEQNKAVTDAATADVASQAAVARSLGANASLVALIIDPHFGADAITSALAVAQAGQSGPTALDGIFALPIPGAPLGSPYGMRIDPVSGGVGYHPGVDFEAGTRTPIHAAAAGVVVVAGDCGGYGSCVVIDHGSSLATVYRHQSQVLARVGDPVTAGQVVGLVGSTGISTGPHLHFEVRLHGVPIDPVPLLAG